MNVHLADLERILSGTRESLKGVEGFLGDAEVAFLTLLGICPTAPGTVLEIGSFKGKSTIALARAARHAEPGARIVAVDPLTSPSVTDPDLRGQKSGLEDFTRNIRLAGVEGNVEFHQAFSRDVAASWDRPIRLLWIDGDHTYEGVKEDLELFAPHLADGAIVAFHDLCHWFTGPERLFCEAILLSEHFGACGICQSIGWAQYHADPAGTRPFRQAKLALHARLAPIAVMSALRDHPPIPFTRSEKIHYKLLRARVPRSPVDPARWAASISLRSPSAP